MPSRDHPDAGNVADNLPHALSTIYGRDGELDTLLGILSDSSTRLIVILGAGGVGKTTLALEAARRSLQQFADGARFLELGSLEDPHRLAESMMRVVAPRLSEQGDAEALLVSALRNRHQLLVLDCFERLVAASPLISRILAACPKVTILATSRVRLRLSGSRELWLAPLLLPEPESVTLPHELLTTPAIRLFIDRSLAAAPHLSIDSAQAEVVAAICRRVDGLPLAIELAASRCAHLSPSALLPLLAKRLTLLTGGNLDAPHRHRTMRDSIAWSVELLSEEEQRAFRRLGVLSGPFTMPAAAHVIGQVADDYETETLLQLSSLVDKCLLQRDDSLAEEPRFIMLDTIREYAIEQLDAAGERREASIAQVAYIRALTAKLIAPPPGSIEEALAVLELEMNLAGVRAALASLGTFGPRGEQLSLAADLERYWRISSRQPEGIEWLTGALARQVADADRETGKGFESLGYLYRDTANYQDGVRVFRQALAAYERVNYTPGIARTLNSLGALAIDMRDHEEGRARNEAALEIQQADGDGWGVARSLHNLGWIAIEDGDLRKARELFEQSVELWALEQDLDSAARAKNSLGGLASMQGDFTRAIDHYNDALAMLRSIGAKSLVAESLVDLAAALLGQRQIAPAAENLGEALAIYHTIGARFRFAEAVEVSSAVALAVRRFRLANRWLGFADTLRRESAIAPAITWQERLDRWRMEARTTLAEPEAPDAMPPTVQQVIAESISLSNELSGRREEANAERQTLSRREREVLELVATGMTDQQIADALFISRRTASTHVAAILVKLEVPSRSAAAAHAIREGLA